MEFFSKTLNGLSDTTRTKRIASYEKLLKLCSDSVLSEAEEFDVLRRCLYGFEDASERCREYALNIVTRVLPRQSSSVLDWVLPAIVTRIGVSPVVEESEELRLQLLRLAALCMETFPHEIGPRNYIDFFQVLLENCLCDEFPDLKKEACRACVLLCKIEPVQVKHIAMPLANIVKQNLLHKHSLVRVEAVKALASLIEHGAGEILSDAKDEPENCTTTVLLFILSNDHVEAVRVAVVELLSVALLDIVERQEQHRRLLPHLLLLMTDLFDVVSKKACEVLNNMGKLYMLDNEDNTINLSKRRVTMKDIEWYGDDEYPDMSLASVDVKQFLALQRRPSLGARYVVAEALRGFIEKLFADVTAIDWVIKFSSNNRRVVALRILWMSIYHAEKFVVQFVEQILAVLYKSLREDNKDVSQESRICLEIMGKFLTPDQYLPFLTSKENVKKTDDDESILIQCRLKTVLISPAAGTQSHTLTFFSTAAVSVKCGILEAFRYLLAGSKHLLTGYQAIQIIKAMTSVEVLESESEDLLCSLLDTLSMLIGILEERGFISTPKNPLPAEVCEDLTQKTLDSIIFYALLCLKTPDFPSVKERVSRCITGLSLIVTGKENGIHSLHFGRLLFRYGSQMPVGAFAELVLNAQDIENYAEQVSGVFLVKLTDIDTTTRIIEELQYIKILEQLLWQKKAVFTETQLEELLRMVIIPLGTFRPGHQAHLFRKIAVSCLCAIFEEHNRCLLDKSFAQNEFALSTKAVAVWCAASDADDAEMRLVCMASAASICCLPLSVGSVSDIFQSILLRLDDSSDILRAKAASGLLSILKAKNYVSPVVIDYVVAQVVPLVKKLLIHLDDIEETVGLRAVLVNVLKCVATLSPLNTGDLVRASLTKHQDSTYCEDVLRHIESL